MNMKLSVDLYAFDYLLDFSEMALNTVTDLILWGLKYNAVESG